MENSFSLETKTCKRCGRETSVLEIFPGCVCIDCYSKKEGQQPLTQSDFNGMVNTFKRGGR